jgi:hypothetical protein
MEAAARFEGSLRPLTFLFAAALQASFAHVSKQKCPAWGGDIH